MTLAKSALLVDSHCHLNFPDFAQDLDAVIDRARASEIAYMQTICTKRSDIEPVLKISTTHEEVYCSIGTHPHEAEREAHLTTKELIQYSAHEKVIGFGETGLDYSRSGFSCASQKRSFLNHIEAAQVTGLPVIIHARDADEDMENLLAEQMRVAPFKALLHCFTSTPRLAHFAIEHGIYVSISGIVTFKSAHALQSLVKTLPLASLLIETDAPYLAPVPMRSKRNEPAFVKYTAEFIAGLLGVEPNEFARQTTQNFCSLFGKCANGRC